MKTFKNTDTQYSVTEEIAWIATVHLCAEFTHKGRKYKTNCLYSNGIGIEYIDIFDVRSDKYVSKEKHLIEIAEEIFFEMDIEKHLTL